MVGEILAAALPGDAHRTDCSTDFLFLLHRQNYHNRALQGLVVPVLPVHKEKRKTVLLLQDSASSCIPPLHHRGRTEYLLGQLVKCLAV